MGNIIEIDEDQSLINASSVNKSLNDIDSVKNNITPVINIEKSQKYGAYRFNISQNLYHII